ncbi:hypothetical protein [Cellulosimicrobium sp. Marseille-Q4280]|uniref:hypothetical protein n=1 Tax=Cellulosimicrobium sp. Marseille-Q4280 TaxID=2937992 RepID=UPI00203E229B|nr:hypothetical protein [Cellulosimicrobium sp. Marseille-Q4280]
MSTISNATMRKSVRDTAKVARRRLAAAGLSTRDATRGTDRSSLALWARLHRIGSLRASDVYLVAHAVGDSAGTYCR